MLGGNTARLRLVDRALTLFVSIGMIFGTFVVATAPPADAVTNTDSFEVGGPETGQGSLSGLIQGSSDWDDLAIFGAGTLDPGEVLIIDDTGYGNDLQEILNPATADEVAANCPNINDDDIIAGGTEIDDYPFSVVDGSVPGKVDLCQVYISYGIDGDGDTILFVGALRREVNGTVAIAVELNKVSHSQRSTDDLLVTFEFDGNGPVSDILVRQWEGSAWGTPESVEADGDSWEHFGEIRVNLSDNDILAPPTSADDCSSFSSVLPYGFRGNDANSQVGDWLDPAEVRIPRCGQLRIIKDATPASGNLEFGWNLEDNGAVFEDLDGAIEDGETVTLDLVNGEYSLTEDVVPSPYAFDRIECDGGFEPDAITVETGSVVTCTIYNLASSLIVEKIGAGDGSASFTFSATGQAAFDLSLGEQSQTFVYVPGTTVDIGETLPGGQPAWHSAGASCVDEDGNGSEVASSDGTSVSVDTIAGDTIVCTFTNNQDGQITVVKEVVNDDGGTLGVGDFPLFLNGGAVTSGTANYVTPGEYTASETNQDGYAASGPVCLDDGSGANVGHPVDLDNGQTVTCTITNDDEPSTLTLLKSVAPTSGGTAADTEWTLNADGPDSISGVEGSIAVTSAEVEAGSYDLSESNGPTGWVQSGDWDCGSATMVDGDTVTVGIGEVVTCEVTNTDVAPQLTLVKDVQNNNGGNADTGDFELTATGPVTVSGFTGDTSVTDAEVLVGSYDLSEDGPAGYDQVGDWACLGGSQIDGDTVQLAPGEDATCTVTNQDEAPELIVTKVVNNDFGGDAEADDFQLRVNETAVDQDTPIAGIVANTAYRVSEDSVDGYFQLGPVACVDTDTQESVVHPVTLDEGQSVTCTVTNQDIAPGLTLVKEVDNQFGGDAEPADFQLTLNGANTNQGAQTGTESNTEYTIDEIQLDGYTQVGDVTCVDDDTQESVTHPVTLDEGQSVTCTITNTDIAPGLIVVKEVINDDGGDAEPGDFQLRVNGTAVAQGETFAVAANFPQTLAEDAVAGYEMVGISCVETGSAIAVPHPVSLDEGQSVTCTITNDDIAPELIVVKEVVNDDTGVADAGDFQLLVNGDEVDQNVVLDVVANSQYTVGEVQLQGYTQVGTAVCVDNDTGAGVAHPVTLVPGQSVTCTVTNDDIEDEVLPTVLPFTGLAAEELLALAAVLAMAGIVIVITARRRNDDIGLDR